MFWNIGITRTNQNKLLLIIGVMLSAMLLPSLEIHPSLPHVRLDDALIFGACAVNLFLCLTRRFRSVNYSESSYHEGQSRGLRVVTQVFLLFFASIVISNIFAVIFLKISFGIRDVMEGVTLAKYYLAITLALSLDLYEGEFNVLRKTFLVGFGVILLLSWGQFLNLANVNAWLTPFFAQSHLDNLVNANPPRVLGTFDNPNVMGIFSVLMMTLFTTWFYFRINNRSSGVILFVVIGLIIKLTFMTISRTALLATATVLVFLSLWAMFKFRCKKGILFKVGVLALLTLTIFFTSPRDFVSRMNEATDIKKSTSAQGHFMRMGSAFELIKQSPILGWGTAKSNMTTLVDNEYALVTRRYGVIGLVLYLWFFIRPVKSALWRVKSVNSYVFEMGIKDYKTLLSIAFTAGTLAILVYNLTAGTFYNLQLMTLVALFMGIIYRIEGESD
ncbi:MAG: O-antigen ligase family protein [Desulfitobacteriaceae bacterium]